MRRPLLIPLLALACAHAKPLPTPVEIAEQHDRAVLEHHLIDLSLPGKGGRCTARVIPLDNGTCATASSVPGHVKLDEGSVACGKTVDLCGHALACDCSKPLPADPCQGHEVRG